MYLLRFEIGFVNEMKSNDNKCTENKNNVSLTININNKSHVKRKSEATRTR